MQERGVITLSNVSHRYGRTRALDDVSLEIPAGKMIGFIGPDGVGKSTLFGLVAGARKIQSGEIKVLGQDIGNDKKRKDLLPRIAYMPQGLGKNLYMDLTVFENLDFSPVCSVKVRLSGKRGLKHCSKPQGLIRSPIDPPGSFRAV